MKYICPRCNYSTNRKSNFKNHLVRKKICDSVIRNVSINSIAKTYNIELKHNNKNNNKLKTKSKIIGINNNNELKHISKTVSTLLKKLERNIHSK